MKFDKEEKTLKQLEVQILSYDLTGIVDVLIGNMKYSYQSEVPFIEKFIYILRFSQGKALTYLKKHSKLIGKEEYASGNISL